MGGDTVDFHRLWLAAGRPSTTSGTSAVRIAGRRHELTAVSRHLESGHGLLVVTGEAGIGKTALVSAAAAGAETFVATGACRPLSTEVPLLPVAGVLRQIRREHPTWFDEALTACPAYVAGVLGQILPELAGEDVPEVSEEWARQRLFHGVDAMLSALLERRPLALLIEDAHWSDATTLDLIELLAGHACPLVLTVRTDDPDIEEAFGAWLSRVSRLPGVARSALDPLTLAETAEQLEILRGHVPEPDQVAQVYARSLGQPLFTEQLELHPHDRHLPEPLSELLRRRLRGLSDGGWAVARALGVADRPLHSGQLQQIAGLDPVPHLRELDEQRLLAPPVGTDVRLRHPLVADAIREHLVAGEATEVHRRVATLLEETADPPAAEIAPHWAAAGDAEKELHWRIAAARAASERFAVTVARDQWLRVLDLWPDEVSEAGDPPLSRAAMYVAVLDAVERLDFAGLVPIMSKALEVAEDAAPEHRAAILLRAGQLHSWLDERDRALEMTSQAVAIYEEMPVSRDRLLAYHSLRAVLEGLGRYRESARAGLRAVEEARSLGIPSELKEALAQRSWAQAVAGDTSGARATIKELSAIELDPPDPYCEIEVAVNITDILLMSGALADELVTVAQPALDAADTWALHQWADAILRSNVAEALVAQGHVQRAWELVAPHTEGDLVEERWPLHEQRAVLELMRGRTDEARGQIEAVATGPLPRGGLSFRLVFTAVAATIDLWTGHPAAAFDRALPVLESGLDTEEPGTLAPLLVLAARAVADLAPCGDRDRLVGLHRRLTRDPFAPHPIFAAGAAYGATWAAEMARAGAHDSLDRWVAAAVAWDHLARPYDAAYCRWRGAQVALATSQGTTARRLMRRATADARGHVPLSDAIGRTAGQGGDRV
jgi:tetratricopeptide (TPR) repeat protein